MFALNAKARDYISDQKTLQEIFYCGIYRLHLTVRVHIASNKSRSDQTYLYFFVASSQKNKYTAPSYAPHRNFLDTLKQIEFGPPWRRGIWLLRVETF